MRYRECVAYGCMKLVREDSNLHCKEHQNLYEEKKAKSLEELSKRKKKPAAVYQTKEWRSISRKFLQSNKTCQCGAVATETHHKIPLRLGGTHDSENLEAVCKPCHILLNRISQKNKGKKVLKCGTIVNT